jgi:hypothetical protein
MTKAEFEEACADMRKEFKCVLRDCSICYGCAEFFDLEGQISEDNETEEATTP